MYIVKMSWCLFRDHHWFCTFLCAALCWRSVNVRPSPWRRCGSASDRKCHHRDNSWCAVWVLLSWESPLEAEADSHSGHCGPQTWGSAGLCQWWDFSTDHWNTTIWPSTVLWTGQDVWLDWATGRGEWLRLINFVWKMTITPLPQLLIFK